MMRFERQISNKNQVQGTDLKRQAKAFRGGGFSVEKFPLIGRGKRQIIRIINQIKHVKDSHCQPTV
jgi:hypothetical protein